MRKIMNWVGALVLVLIIVQSSIGIISNAQTGTPQGFAGGMARMNFDEANGFSGTPPQNNTEGNNATSENDEGSNTSSDVDTSTQNGRMQMNMNPQEQSGFSATLRSFTNGMPGLVLNCLSLGLGISWIVLFFLTRKKQETLTA